MKEAPEGKEDLKRKSLVTGVARLVQLLDDGIAFAVDCIKASPRSPPIFSSMSLSECFVS
jgi:hypothetical protein